MSNFSRIACSLVPVYCHHRRSRAKISRSRSVSDVDRPRPRSPDFSAALMWGVYDMNYTCVICHDVFVNTRVERSVQKTVRWGILATGHIAESFARDLELTPGHRL